MLLSSLKRSWPNNDDKSRLMAAEDFFKRLNSRLTTWIKQAWKWEQASTLSFDFNIICSTFTQMTDCNTMHLLSASWIFMIKMFTLVRNWRYLANFSISSSLGINQSELVGFHPQCCYKRHCQNKSYLLSFSIRLGYKLCNITTEKVGLSLRH